VASLLLGAAVAGACLIAFAIGTRNQTYSTTEIVPSNGIPAVSIPSGFTYTTCTNASCVARQGNFLNGIGTPNSSIVYEPLYECTTTAVGGGTVCTITGPVEPVSPSPSS
jgi:hypothetical protein